MGDRTAAGVPRPVVCRHGGRRTSGVISRACSRRSSCSWRARFAVDSSPVLPAVAACSAAIGLLMPPPPEVPEGTPLIVEQYGQRT